jgi:uncharacterized protein (TIGR03437 family)
MRNWKFLLACGLLCVSILPAQTGVPTINSGGVVNAADYTVALAHGSIFSVWGANLAASTAKAPSVPLPTTLDGVTVEVVDGSRVIAAPLFFVSAGQINAQLPFEVTSASVGVRVKNARGTSNTQTVSVTARAPRLFTRTLDGRGEAIVTHADFSIVEAAKPAAPNEVVLVFLTGLGQTSPLATSGKAAGDNATNGPLNWVRETVTVTVAGQAGIVHFSGLAPGFVGLYQLNVQLPASLPGGAQPLLVACGGQSSQASVTVAIRSVLPIATVNLGSGGGLAQAGGATIDVPAGLLTGSSTVSIYKAEPEATATSRLTSVYAVEGLPTLPTAPVTLTAELKRPPDAGKSTFLLWRWHVDREGSGNSMILPATVDGTKATGTLPAWTSSSSTKSASGWRADSNSFSGEFLFVEGSRYTCREKGNFQIWVLSDAKATYEQVCELDAQLENAKTKLETDLGLDFSRRKIWPIEVYIHNFYKWEVDAFGLKSAKEDWASGCTGPRPNKDNVIQLNARYYSDPTAWSNVRMVPPHELFHVWQRLNDPRNDAEAMLTPSPWKWFWEATSNWIMMYLSPDRKLVPWGADGAADVYAFIRHGLEYKPSSWAEYSAVADHGYAASLFVQSLVQEHKAKMIGDIFKLWSQYPDSAVDAINAVTGDAGAEWRRFCYRFMSQILVSGFPSEDMIKGMAVSTISLPDGDHEYFMNLPDLSAGMALFTLPSTWDTKTNLAFSLKSPANGAEILASQEWPSTPWWMGVSKQIGETYEIKDAEGLARNNAVFYMLFANGRAVKPYDGSSRVTLQTSVKRLSALDLVKAMKGFTAEMMVQATCSNLTVTPPTTYNCSAFANVYNYWSTDIANSLMSAWNGNTLTTMGTLTDPKYPTQKYDVTIRYTFSDNGRTITSGQVRSYYHGPNGSDIEFGYDLKGIPLSQTPASLDWNQTSIGFGLPAASLPAAISNVYQRWLTNGKVTGELKTLNYDKSAFYAWAKR